MFWIYSFFSKFIFISILVQPWWKQTFTEAERNLWAVMDIHNYLAWGGDYCEGRLANVSGGGYKCDDSLNKIRAVLQDCLLPWATQFAEKYPGLRSCTEFSLGTSQDSNWASSPDKNINI